MISNLLCNIGIESAKLLITKVVTYIFMKGKNFFITFAVERLLLFFLLGIRCAESGSMYETCIQKSNLASHLFLYSFLLFPRLEKIFSYTYVTGTYNINVDPGDKTETHFM